MRVFLVRHGMSQSNADAAVNAKLADHAIGLTEEGKQQAHAAGEFLAGYFDEHLATREGSSPDASAIPKIRLWLSPYMRTRQTADAIERACVLGDSSAPSPAAAAWSRAGAPPVQLRAGDSWFLDRREHLLLAEQQFGVFDGLSDAERQRHYPREWAYYEKCKQFEGKLWPKLPLGESRFEVCQRVHQSFGSFKRDEERHGIDNIVIVGHGTVNRAFTMMWLHLPYEWMHAEPNPRNCSVRLIEDGEDKGYIFPGFDNPPGYEHSINHETEE